MGQYLSVVCFNLSGLITSPKQVLMLLGIEIELEEELIEAF